MQQGLVSNGASSRPKPSECWWHELLPTVRAKLPAYHSFSVRLPPFSVAATSTDATRVSGWRATSGSEASSTTNTFACEATPAFGAEPFTSETTGPTWANTTVASIRAPVVRSTGYGLNFMTSRLLPSQLPNRVALIGPTL